MNMIYMLHALHVKGSESRSYKGEMGNEVRVKPKISLESPQKSATFGVENGCRRPFCSLWGLPKFEKIGGFTNRSDLGDSL